MSRKEKTIAGIVLGLVLISTIIADVLIKPKTLYDVTIGMLEGEQDSYTYNTWIDSYSSDNSIRIEIPEDKQEKFFEDLKTVRVCKSYNTYGHTAFWTGGSKYSGEKIRDIALAYAKKGEGDVCCGITPGVVVDRNGFAHIESFFLMKRRYINNYLLLNYNEIRLNKKDYIQLIEKYCGKE